MFQPTGSQTSIGANTSRLDLHSSSQNPASPSFMMNGKEGFQSNFIAPIGAGYELGQIDSLVDELDELIDILEKDNLTAEEALEAKDRFDPFLVNAARDGMIKVAGNFAVPFFPMFYHANEWGTFSANLGVFGSLRSTVIDDTIEILSINDSFKINTDAAVYVKSAGLVTLGLGYSRPVFKSENAIWHAGIKANINQYELAKNVISLAGLEDGEQIGDAIKDDYENNAQSTTNIGVDLGIIYSSEHLQAGLAIKDINEPEYDYGDISASVAQCNALSGVSVDNCFVAQSIIAQGRIRGQEKYVANAQATLSAATHIDTSFAKWGFYSSVDLNDKNDAIGDIYQWANVGASAAFDNWFVPEFRVGYTKNLAGTELGYYSVGITFLKQAELDIRWSDQTVLVDDDQAPRSAYFSFAIQTKF